MKTITTIFDKTIEVTAKTICVVMTDKMLSGWGCAEGKIHKRVYLCKDSKEAHTLKDRLMNPKHQMTYVAVHYGIPYYTPSRYTVAYDEYSDTAFNF